MPVGSITRGTTNTNRLRRVDRWIAAQPEFLRAPDPLVVDLGYGASGVTAFELATRLRRARADTRILGIEIEPGRVRTATQQLDEVRAGRTGFAPDLPVGFALGGFEVAVPGGASPAVIRAFNVLRQYDEADVAAAWARMTARLAPGGLLVEGTCDEVGRVASWVGVTDAGPATFTVSLRLAGLDAPSVLAERLPKALIHRNVPGNASTTCSAHSTAPGACTRRCRCTGPPSGGSRSRATCATTAGRSAATCAGGGSANSPSTGRRSRRAGRPDEDGPGLEVSAGCRAAAGAAPRRQAPHRRARSRPGRPRHPCRGSRR
ncbi:hypothetical protein GCM10025870_27550 [Agromyces marinus]|uniref:Class I SAM-dependent methyltransferase n=1 Tax=Agromyces marinus TaxID=1389020 RepID=A0ABM8H4F6_9MICO|nr:hypothetical protein GCM10025870_27550 [Agromyces marinus]